MEIELQVVPYPILPITYSHAYDIQGVTLLDGMLYRLMLADGRQQICKFHLEKSTTTSLCFFPLEGGNALLLSPDGIDYIDVYLDERAVKLEENVKEIDEDATQAVWKYGNSRYLVRIIDHVDMHASDADMQINKCIRRIERYDNPGKWISVCMSDLRPLEHEDEIRYMNRYADQPSWMDGIYV